MCSHVILIQCYSVVEHSAASTVTLTLHRNLLAIELDWASLQNMSLTPMHTIFINNTDDTHTLAAIPKFISHPQSSNTRSRTQNGHKSYYISNANIHLDTYTFPIPPEKILAQWSTLQWDKTYLIEIPLDWEDHSDCPADWYEHALHHTHFRCSLEGARKEILSKRLEWQVLLWNLTPRLAFC